MDYRDRLKELRIQKKKGKKILLFYVMCPILP